MPKKKRSSNNSQNKKEEDDGYPKLSILTPLYNRNKWIPMMICNLKTFDYDHNKLEWFVLDSKDGDDDVKLVQNESEIKMIQDMIKPIKFKYTYIDKKMTIAEKRNYLTKNMTHKWFANLDSDDVYIESYLKYSIDECRKKKAGLAGSPQMIFCYPHYEYKICGIQCGSARQCHEATFVGKQQYWRSMGGYNKNDEKGEGAGLIDDNDGNVAQTDCIKCMICVSHNSNTCSKEMFKDTNVQGGSLQGIKLEILQKIMAEEVENGFQDLSKFGKPEPKPQDI
tara:strand:- start:4887 stop:5729 length:843 start_codon:yes stop_codon:yes gene_type:complete